VPRGAWAACLWAWQCLVCPRPGPNAILGPALPGPWLALGHAWQDPSQSATWRLDYIAEEANQAQRGACMSALRREPKHHVSPWAMPSKTQAKAPPGAWTTVQRKQAKRIVALACPPSGGNPSAICPNLVFFIVISVF